ncbi:MAG: methyltransferase domain-containing protein [Verrucomicrobiaceae bacterium]|nr:MAG: methyltransferase domain-containing protein [Verrucomicrobiaceae bacterium]
MTNDAQFPPRPTALAQEILRPLIAPGDTVVDATAGNGHDTCFLAGCVGKIGKVLAFDVQEAAISASRELLLEAGLAGRVELVHGSHSTLESHAAAGSVAVVMFNLGYLPGEDHALTTEAAETLAALQAAGRVLRPGGILSVVCYPGHPAGAVEAEAVEAWLAGKTADGWRVARYGAIGTRRPAPYLLVARIG